MSKIVPEVDESVINLGPWAKLSVSYGLQKPKLSDITLSEFNVASTRTLYRLIQTGQLSSYLDIKAYLCYTVKINELAAKFRWQNVLKYDEEFCQLQAKHSLPWTYDSYHLHTKLLSPSGLGSLNSSNKNNRNFKTKGTIASNIFAKETKDGKIICVNFNIPMKGCHRDNCTYERVCNRKVGDGGQACSLPHPGFQHFSVVKSS